MYIGKEQHTNRLQLYSVKGKINEPFSVNRILIRKFLLGGSFRLLIYCLRRGKPNIARYFPVYFRACIFDSSGLRNTEWQEISCTFWVCCELIRSNGQELRPRITAAWRLPLETRFVQGKNEVAAVLTDIGLVLAA